MGDGVGGIIKNRTLPGGQYCISHLMLIWHISTSFNDGISGHALTGVLRLCESPTDCRPTIRTRSGSVRNKGFEPSRDSLCLFTVMNVTPPQKCCLSSCQPEHVPIISWMLPYFRSTFISVVVLNFCVSRSRFELLTSPNLYTALPFIGT